VWCWRHSHRRQRGATALALNPRVGCSQPVRARRPEHYARSRVPRMTRVIMHRNHLIIAGTEAAKPLSASG
jgi:hypothetical protein